jgi:hypothetical protein
MPPEKRHLFQVNHHVQASIMLLSIMDGAELDLNNTMLSSSSKTTTSTTPNVTTTLSSISTSDDYEKGTYFSLYQNLLLLIIKQNSLDLQLAAELGRCLLERNQELQAYIGVLQKQIDDEQCDIKVRRL